jgi:pyruvate dehydrogenase E2 component (dihydrolipoamide acetyltransferase)
MPTEITMPALGPNVETGSLARWLVREGQQVKPGDIIAEIETDKAMMEVEASGVGVLAKLLVADGAEQVKVGTAIALLALEGEEPGAVVDSYRSHGAAESVAVVPAQQAVTNETSKPPPFDRSDGRRIKASPMARRLARAHGISLSAARGSGPAGRIVKADIENVIAQTTAPATTQAVAMDAPDIPHETIKLTAMRKVIARRLSESKTTIPHFYLSVDVRLDALLKLRAQFNEAVAAKVSLNDWLIKGLAAALLEVPDANVRFAADQLYRFLRADIAVAVAVPGGLVTPLIQDAGRKSVTAIATEMRDLAGRAREGKLAPHEYQGGTASLSNLGMFGIKQFEAVINPPQALILAVGAGEKRPVVDADTLGIATVLTATGSFDHRAIDGATGAALMAAFKRVIEQPLGLLA